MSRREYTLVDVFTDRKFGGDQLAVFHDGARVGDALSASDGTRIVSEQGFEMGRPSPLYVRVGCSRDRITSAHVGGGWLEL